MTRVVILLAIVFLGCVTSRAESWPPIDQLASSAAVILHGKIAATEGDTIRVAVSDVWKGAYDREAFVPPPPAGTVIIPAKGAPAAGECLLFYATRSQVGGKFQRPDIVLPVVAGKVTYPGPTADGPKREFLLPAFRAALQASLKNPLVNGGFDQPAVGDEPLGWKAAYPNGAGVITTEGNETFLRLASTTGANAGMAQVVAVSPKATQVTVLGRMRGKPRNEKDDKRAAVQVALRFLDAKNGSINAAIVASESSPNWRTFRREFKLPPGASQVEIVARSVFAVGTFDFDEVRVEFK